MSSLYKSHYLKPKWPAPQHVKAYVTTRRSGQSKGPWASFNLSYTVGDNAAHVKANRQQLHHDLALPETIHWLTQQHTTKVIELNQNTQSDIGIADGVYSYEPNKIAMVSTADCLPILICDRLGQMVMALHAGWRGLAAGIIERGIARLDCPREDIIVWLGPCIQGDVYEVGSEVRAVFLEYHSEDALGFTPSHKPEHWLLDMLVLAKRRLQACGVTAIYGGDYCTFKDKQFFSYRRDGVCGRMASLIWFS